MSESSICGALFANLCVSGIGQWCNVCQTGGNNAGDQQSGCFSRGCGGYDDEDAFDRADREERERKRLAKEQAAGTGTHVQQPGAAEPMLAVVNPEYLASVEADKVGGTKP